MPETYRILSARDHGSTVLLMLRSLDNATIRPFTWDARPFYRFLAAQGGQLPAIIDIDDTDDGPVVTVPGED